MGGCMIYCNKRKKHIKPEVGQVWLDEINNQLILLMIGKDNRLLWSQNPSKGVVKTGIDASKHPTIGYLVSELIQEAPKPKSQWQPIETAPSGNERVLLYHGNYTRIGCFGDWTGIEPPTHWMPLPDAPEIEVE